MAFPLNCTPADEEKCRSLACMTAQRNFIDANNQLVKDCTQLGSDTKCTERLPCGSPRPFAARSG